MTYNPVENRPFTSDLVSQAEDEEKEAKMEQKQMIVATPFEIMDRLDDEQIIAKMKGAVIDTFVYSYSDSAGKKVEGLSKTGVDESCKQLANKGEVIRELECVLEAQDDTYAYFKAKSGRYAVNPEGTEVLLETKIGHKRQSKYVVGKGNVPNKDKPNPFWYEQGGQKALRNCRRDLLSEKFIIELINQWKKQGKVKEIKETNGAQTQAPVSKPQGTIGETVNFGTYKGLTFEEVYQKNMGWFKYILAQPWIKKDEWADFKEKIEQFLDAQRFKDEEHPDDGVN